MSGLNTYSTEPATKGKVILHTSLGPLDVELWPKEAPKACRNFVQLCVERYYDGHTFHRVIKDFMAQTGDPTGTGTGGESVYGAPFEDEFHGRLRFTHRGLLAMANSAPNSNGSQFFVTLDRCDWLDKRHTIFGKVTGNSIYNLNRFGEIEVGEGDVPLHAPIIQSTEILFDPFEDIVPRQIVHRNPQLAAQADARAAAEAARDARRPKKVKNKSLLSFGGEEDEVVEPALAKRAKSVHDVLHDDPRLSAELAVELEREATQTQPTRARANGRAAADGEEEGEEAEAGAGADFASRMRQQQQDRRAQLVRRAQEQADGAASAEGADGSRRAPPPPPPPSRPREEEGAIPRPAAPPTEYERLKAELVAGAAAAKGGWKWRGKGADSDDDDGDDGEPAAGAKSKGKASSELEARRARFVSKARQLKGLDKKDRARETALKMRMFERSIGDSGLLAHKLEPLPKLMAEGTDDMYEMTDPLAAREDDMAESRAMQKIAERQQRQQLSMRANTDDPEWRRG